ncbi:MAG: branched chain amino acid aminotransferase, partial [Clostridia bacterium]|nr:branched chain amino acid aminotransferase [Clostridia bacterium]
MNISITKTTNPIEKPTKDLGFGKYFTDHMFIMDYEAGEGWKDARIVPFAPIALHPAATVFHYGAEVFEGLKAYRRADGEIQFFRPIENARRINSSAERIRLPEIPEEDFMQALTELVKVDADWVP